MTSAELAQAIETRSLPNREFGHREHVQLAVHYLRALGYPNGEAALLRLIRRFAEGHGHGEKFHYTLSCAWVRIVAGALDRESSAGSFASFIEGNPKLLEHRLPLHYYSRERLFADEARRGWVEPDIQALPVCRPHPGVTAWD